LEKFILMEGEIVAILKNIGEIYFKGKIVGIPQKHWRNLF